MPAKVSGERLAKNPFLLEPPENALIEFATERPFALRACFQKNAENNARRIRKAINTEHLGKLKNILGPVFKKPCGLVFK